MLANKKILIGFLICCAILLVIGIFSFETSRKFISANKSVDHTHQVLHEFEKILITSLDATIGERGYIRTGEEKLLEPYFTAKTEAKLHFATVRALTKDNLSQRVNIDSLENLFGKLTGFYEQCIALRKAGRPDDAIALFLTGRGVRIESDLKKVIRQAQHLEERLLADRMQLSDADANEFRSISILLIVAILALMAGTYMVIVGRARIFKKTEEQSIKTISDYRSALDTSSIVAITDQRGIINYVNDNFCKISKYSQEELLGQDHRIINSGYHSREFIRSLWQTIENGKIWKGELRNRAKDGSIYWVDTTIVPFLNEEGKPYQYMAIRSDITERKMLEDNLRKLNLELENKVDERTRELVTSLEREKELSDIKSRFVSMASHEFRTPLSTIMSSAGLIESYREPEHLEKRLRHVERIKSSVKNLTDILNDFLSLDKLEQGKIIAENSSFDITQFLKEIGEEMEGMLKRKNQWITYVHNGVSEITTDKKILRNVMFNLISNASKYSEEAKEIHLTTEVDNEYVCILVKDNGIGIPDEDQKHLFGKFFRAKNTGNIQGTGLGLSIVRHYVELMDGNIAFTSRENFGTTFTIKIPRHNALT